jgi:hypothetical protein
MFKTNGCTYCFTPRITIAADSDGVEVRLSMGVWAGVVVGMAVSLNDTSITTPMNVFPIRLY